MDLSEENTITECKSHHRTVTNIVYIHITDTCLVQYNMNTIKVVLDHTINIESNITTSEYAKEQKLLKRKKS